jgi:hypothetical protein
MSNRRNRILPPNMMNINTVRSGMLGKRKRVNNRNNVSNRPQKRTDLYMIAEVGKVTPDKINIRLPRRIVNELRDLNKKSSRNRWEYAGKIEFRPNPNKSMVKFNNPQRFTSQLRNAITSETYQLLYDSYIAYHTHPTAYTPNNLKNNNAMNVNNNARKILVTLPSGADMEAYIGTYPNMQANMISDENGYYVIDLIETTGREKPNAVEVNRTMEWLRTQPFFQDRYRTLGGYEYFETTLTDWKKSINQELNPFLQRLFGISIKYYGYNDEPAIVTLARAS